MTGRRCPACGLWIKEYGLNNHVCDGGAPLPRKRPILLDRSGDRLRMTAREREAASRQRQMEKAASALTLTAPGTTPQPVGVPPR